MSVRDGEVVTRSKIAETKLGKEESKRGGKTKKKKKKKVIITEIKVKRGATRGLPKWSPNLVLLSPKHA